MVDFKELEALLKEVVGGKRLSASKMTKFQEMALKSLKHDTKLVSMLYRTHKSLPKSQKISSFYVFDALARAAKHQANKHSLAIEERPSDKPGNAGSFLFKLEGILDGLVEDMMTVGTSEANDKTRKVLEIWKKANTFPADVLSRLLETVDHGGQGTAAENASTSTPPTTDAKSSQSTEPPTTAVANDLPPAILALLGAPLPTNGFVPNTMLAAPAPAPLPPNPAPLEPSQLALLQQLTQQVAAMAPPAAALATGQPLGGRGPNDPPYMIGGPTYMPPPPFPPPNRYQEEREDPRRPRLRDPPRYDRPLERNSDNDVKRRYIPAGRDRNVSAGANTGSRWERPPPPRRDQRSRSRSRSPPTRSDPRRVASPVSMAIPRGQAIPSFTSAEPPSRGAQTMQTNPIQGKQEASSHIQKYIAPSSSTPVTTLATLDVSSFDMASAESWASLGAAFKATHGRDGTQEELVATLMALQNGIPPPSFGGGINMQNNYNNQGTYWSNPGVTIGTWETREVDDAKHGGRYAGHGSYDDGIGYAIGPGRWQSSDAVVLTGNDEY